MIEWDGDVDCGVHIEPSDNLVRLGAVREITEEQTLQAFVKVEDVAAIDQSVEQTPLNVYRKIREAGETGMGYYIFSLRLSDGRSLKCFSGGGFEFLRLPSGVAPHMIQDVTPCVRDASDVECRDAETSMCLYRRPTAVLRCQ